MTQEQLVLFKLAALRFYLSNGNMSLLEKDFPKYKDFVLQNKDRDFREVERELMNELLND